MTPLQTTGAERHFKPVAASCKNLRQIVYTLEHLIFHPIEVEMSSILTTPLVDSILEDGSVNSKKNYVCDFCFQSLYRFQHFGI